MKKKIKCAIIGLGKIGLDYDLNKNNQIKTHSKSLFTNKNFSIVGGVDKNFTRRTIFQKEYNLNSYSSINKMFKFNKPEFVVISTPTETHKKVFDEIAKYNSVKLILFEKPISYNLNDLKKIHFISKKKRIKVFINYIRRSNKGFQGLRKKLQIKSKNIKINVFYNNGFINNGIHYLNLLIFYFGKAIKYKILKIKNKLGKDFNIDLLILFKNAEAKFIYKPNSVDKDLEIKINKNVLINYKKKGIYYNKKKIGNNLNFYQKDTVEQIYRYYKKEKYFLCNFKEHFNDMKLIEKIKNEI